MKFKIPAFLDGIESPIEGEIAVRKFALNPKMYDVTGAYDLFNQAIIENSKTIVVGIDEVGRGPLAGPVVACAAVLNSPDILPQLNDSKKLSRSKRESMYELVKNACACYAIASASVSEIDEMNILEADFLAMRRALQALGMPGIKERTPEIPIEVKGSFASVMGSTIENQNSVFIVVDGNLKIRGISQEIQMPIVKGDARVACISASSILAKVFRDRYMDKLAEIYPGYGFEVNAGYGTKAHLEGIRKLGLTKEHRKSFHPKALEM